MLHMLLPFSAAEPQASPTLAAAVQSDTPLALEHQQTKGACSQKKKKKKGLAGMHRQGGCNHQT